MDGSHCACLLVPVSAGRRLLGHDVRAVICLNGVVAFGTSQVRALRDHGLCQGGRVIVGVGVDEGGAMGKRDITATVRRSFVVRSTKASARLERRDVPAGHVRSAKVDEFVAAPRAKA
jgi:hypothetical protein